VERFRLQVPVEPDGAEDDARDVDPAARGEGIQDADETEHDDQRAGEPEPDVSRR
jgi:hypothetical protein